MNGKFFELKKEKQDRMINAALKVFAVNGYRHASTDDIVKEAGISKGLLFHYFDNKLGAYQFVYDYSVRYMSLELSTFVGIRERDVFEVMKLIQTARLDAMKEYPYMQQFLARSTYEDVNEVLLYVGQKKDILENAYQDVYRRINFAALPQGTDGRLLFQLMDHAAEGLIMEHFRDYDYVNQTVHSNYTYHLKQRVPPHAGFPLYNEGDYNTYAVERFPDSVVFSVNGQRTFCYPRYHKGDEGQFPFSNYDYYLILDAQVGCDGSPSIDMSKLPVALRIDYVRYYELDTKSDMIPEPKDFQQPKAKKKKLRKIVYDQETHYENPDEYHLVVKCGKATISGNRNWAKSTLMQLKDENGRIANLEVHDYAACPYRGITLDAQKCRLSAEEMTSLLDLMALYKLNYFQWDGEGGFTAEEIDKLREHARDCGINMVEDISHIPDVSLLNLRDDEQVSAMNQVFLNKAVGNGAFLYLDSFEADDVVTLMAFAERYWRGGDAGAVEDGVVSPAASSLANFMEKAKIHCSDLNIKTASDDF